MFKPFYYPAYTQADRWTEAQQQTRLQEKKKEECGEVERDIDRKEMNKGESEEERMRERRVRGSPPTVTVCVAHGRRRFHSQETNRRRSHVTGRVCLHHSRRPHPINALSQQDKHHHRYLKSIPEFFF